MSFTENPCIGKITSCSQFKKIPLRPVREAHISRKLFFLFVFVFWRELKSSVNYLSYGETASYLSTCPQLPISVFFHAHGQNAYGNFKLVYSLLLWQSTAPTHLGVSIFLPSPTELSSFHQSPLPRPSSTFQPHTSSQCCLNVMPRSLVFPSCPPCLSDLVFGMTFPPLFFSIPNLKATIS